MPDVIPVPDPLFQPHPPTTVLPIYAWRAYTGPTQSITSTIDAPLPLANIGTTVVAMIYYHEPEYPVPSGANARKSRDYGDARPYTFRLPDGTFRVNDAPMNQQAYDNLVDNILNRDVYPSY